MAGGAIAIAYATLFPFDFHFADASLASAVTRLDRTVTEPYVVADALLNFALFVPLGFGTAGVFALRGYRRHIAIVGAVGISISVSFLAELAQATLLVRFASLGDVAANGLGGLVGASIMLRRRFGPSHGVASRLRSTASPSRLAAIHFVALVAAVGASAWYSNTMETSNWDGSYPLLVGNERSGDRPWNGVVASWSLLDRSLTDHEIDEFLRTDRPPGSASVLVHHDFTRVPSGFPELVPRGAGVVTSGSGVEVGAGWLETRRPGVAVAQAAASTSEFTLVVDAASHSLDQKGPARIVSMSDGLSRRNFTLGQEDRDLVLRIRTPFFGRDGTDPELIVPDVFSDGRMLHMIIRYDSGRIAVDVPDAGVNRSMDFVPEAMALFASFPNDIERLRLTGRNEMVFGVLYRAILLAPAAALGVVAWRRRADDPRAPYLVLVTTVMAVLALEFTSSHTVDGATVGALVAVDLLAIVAVMAASMRFLHSGRVQVDDAGSGL